jgi:2-dehydropantoate 2-reductase
MRILVLGAGGIGGYYGGRLAAAGVDVTFLVRPRRAEQLVKNGLVIRSPLGNLQVPVKTILREHVKPGWDAIVVACKSYDLDDAIETIRPAASGALIVPQLNGIRHLDALDDAFGADQVAGGVAAIAVTLDPDGTVHHLNRVQNFAIGARAETQRERCIALHAELVRGGFDPKLSDDIMLDLWEKFAFLCTLAGMCCLMRAGADAIARTQDGTALTLEMLETCLAVSAAAGFPARDRFIASTRKMLTDTATPFAASMLRDLQRGGRVEAEHIVGDMLARARDGGQRATLLRAAYAHLQCYEAQRS